MADNPNALGKDFRESVEVVNSTDHVFKNPSTFFKGIQSIEDVRNQKNQTASVLCRRGTWEAVPHPSRRKKLIKVVGDVWLFHNPVLFDTNTLTVSTWTIPGTPVDIAVQRLVSNVSGTCTSSIFNGRVSRTGWTSNLTSLWASSFNTSTAVFIDSTARIDVPVSNGNPRAVISDEGNLTTLTNNITGIKKINN